MASWLPSLGVRESEGQANAAEWGVAGQPPKTIQPPFPRRATLPGLPRRERARAT